MLDRVLERYGWPRATQHVIAVLSVSALSMSISIMLVLEMEHPFGGVIKVSSAPMRYMISHLGR